MSNKNTMQCENLLQKFTIYLASELHNTQVSIDEAKGTAMIRGTKDGKFFSFIIEQQDKEDTYINPNKKFTRKSDYKDEIKRLYKIGMKQIEIARRLNISQSLVSRLLKNNC